MSFGQSFWFAWFRVIFDVSQDPPMSVHASLSRDGFYYQALWVEHLLTSLSFDLQGTFLCIWSGRSPHFENQKYVIWAEPSLLPQLLYSSWSFSPQGMKLQLLYHGRAHLSPASLWKYRFGASWPSVISVGNPVVSLFVLLKTIGLTSPSFEFRLVSVIFRSFHYICEDVGFPLPSTFGREPEIYSASWVCGLSSLINFGNVLAISSSSITWSF